MKQVLRDALDARGYTTLTPVQEAALEEQYQGKDLLVSAQTGSGKTVGFGLAVAPQLLGDDETFGRAEAPLGLVIAPTRELALQVKRELDWLFEKAGAQIASCVGGMDMRDERRALARGAHIVAATPGRLRDHIMRGSIDLSKLKAVVLDEADEMLDLGFREDLEFILGEAPEERQTLMFSATVPNSISQLAKSYQKDAMRVVAKSGTKQHADITYKAMNVAQHDTENAVINALLYHQAPNAIVFANTRAMVNRLTTRLSNRGFQVVALSGELSQAERTHALQAMRDGRAQVCVATDVAARGIDLPNLDLVVHAELPNNHETLLHRSGRTGRAGRKGVSALIVTRRSARKAERILQMAKVKAEWTQAPSADAVKAREAERMFADESWTRAVEGSEEATVERLESTFTPTQLAAAFLRLYSSVRSAPEELANADEKPAKRQEFGASIWFSISGGRDEGAEPRRLLPMICKAGNLSKDDIGAIRIKQNESYVQILETSVPAFLKAVGNKKELEPGAVISQLAEAPQFESFKSGPKPPRKPRPPKSTPIDWNDDPAPRHRKPKPEDRKPRQNDRPEGRDKPWAKDKPVGGDKPWSKGKSAGKDKPWSKDKPAGKDKPWAKDKPAGRDKPWEKDKPKGKGKPWEKDAPRDGDAPRSKDRKPKREPYDPAVVKERKPKFDAKGPPPPKGKKTSKKNKARAIDAKANAVPKRKGKPKA